MHFYLDGELAEAAEGTPVLLAAMAHGVFIPHLCYHPALSAVGSCRLCLARVEVDGRSSLATTCNLPVREGMRVTTSGPEVRAARAAALEFILARHPLECPTCERAGECELQDFAVAYGRDRGRHHPPGPAAAPVREVLGPHVALERSRCMGCTRCVRFEEEIAGTRRLAVLGLGSQARPGRVGPEPLDHPLSGNLLDLCPAGALVEPGAEASPPPWRRRGTDTVCPGCATGCPVRADALDGHLHRLAPRSADPPWLCDEGRFAWRLVQQPDRFVEPHVREEGALRSTSWDEALEAVASALTRSDTGRVAWVTDGWETLEEAYLRAHVARQVGVQALCLRTRAAAGGDRAFPGGFVISGDRSPNRRGLEELSHLQGVELVSPEALWRSLESGRVRALFWHGGDPYRALGEREVAALAGLDALVVVDLVPSALTELAHIVLPGAATFEREGTLIGGRGQANRLRVAATPPGSARPDWQILLNLAGALGLDLADHMASPREVLEYLLEDVEGAAPDTRPPALARLAAAPPAGEERDGGVAYGGGWATFLQRRGFLSVEDHTCQAEHGHGDC